MAENVNKYLIGKAKTLFFQQGVNPTVQTIYVAWAEKRIGMTFFPSPVEKQGPKQQTPPFFSVVGAASGPVSDRPA
ncbi:MAG TPA: hypothetical protein PLI07_06165, partial [Candidatus Hydrogenedentes bacterium]|nr:hypothetical protein [Candidatus Hydrogenedentota bacterium]